MALFATGKHRKGDNSRRIELMLESENLPPIDIKDPEQVRQRIREYFAFCVQHNLMPQKATMANWVGVSRDTLHSWRVGEFKSKREHQRIVEQAFAVIESVLVDMLQDNLIPAPAGIFMLKNWFGWSDRVDIEIGPTKPDPTSGISAADARRRLLERIAEDGNEGGGGFL